MPGICGIVQRDFGQPQLIESMANSIKHEDWHLTDLWVSSFCGMARVHLGIFNPEPQPIFNEDKSLCIFMDGKIYGYEKERKELQRQGYKFSVDNDPEFCLHLYEEVGKNFVKQLNGTFTIAIIDLKQQKLVIMNDRYGLRPLYYAVEDNRLLIASEVKAILGVKPKRKLNDEAIADFLTFGEILEDKTFFTGIKVLPSASILEYIDGKIHIEQYWDFEYEAATDTSEEEFVEQLVQTLSRAVKRRLVGNYRYGVHLSGGLDSRSIVAAMGEAAPQVIAFTLGVKDCDEVKIARLVTEKSNMNHQIVELNPDELPSYAEDAVWLSDGMGYIGVTFLPPTHEEYRKHVDILLQGLAGDALLGGTFLNAPLMEAKSEDELIQALYHKMALFSEDTRLKLFQRDYFMKVKAMPMSSLRSGVQRAKGEPLVNRGVYFLLQNHVRRATMMGSIIARNKVEEAYPTYDNDFIDLIQQIPPQLRLNHYIYRKFLRELSPELAKIPYQATGVTADSPLALWKVGAYYLDGKARLKELLRSLSGGKILIPDRHGHANLAEWLSVNENWRGLVGNLLDERALSREYLNIDYAKRLMVEHGKLLPPQRMLKAKRFIVDYSRQLLYLATFELFLRLFVKNQLAIAGE